MDKGISYVLGLCVMYLSVVENDTSKTPYNNTTHLIFPAIFTADLECKSIARTYFILWRGEILALKIIFLIVLPLY
jgi:hypothetical protein